MPPLQHFYSSRDVSREIPFQIKIDRLFVDAHAEAISQIAEISRQQKSSHSIPIIVAIHAVANLYLNGNPNPLTPPPAPRLCLDFSDIEADGERSAEDCTTTSSSPGVRKCGPLVTEIGHLEILPSNEGKTGFHVVDMDATLTFPISVADLDEDSCVDLVFICSDFDVPLGFLRFYFFSDIGILRQGRHLLPFTYSSLDSLPTSKTGASLPRPREHPRSLRRRIIKADQPPFSVRKSRRLRKGWRRRDYFPVFLHSRPRCLLTRHQEHRGSPESSSNVGSESDSDGDRFQSRVQQKCDLDSSAPSSWSLPSASMVPPHRKHKKRRDQPGTFIDSPQIYRSLCRAINSYKLLDVADRGHLERWTPELCSDVNQECQRCIAQVICQHGMVALAMPHLPVPVLLPHSKEAAALAGTDPPPCIVAANNAALNGDPEQPSRDAMRAAVGATPFGRELADLLRQFHSFENSSAASRIRLLSACWATAPVTPILDITDPLPELFSSQRRQVEAARVLRDPPPALSAASAGAAANASSAILLGPPSPNDTDAPNLIALDAAAEGASGPLVRDSSVEWSNEKRWSAQGRISLESGCDAASLERELLWRRRGMLREENVSLIKMSRLINWTSIKHVKEFEEMLLNWPVQSVEAALELLSPTSTIPMIRQFAARCLSLADENKICLFLPQLVQAIRWDPPGDGAATLKALLQWSLRSPRVASLLYWALQCEAEDPEMGYLFIRGHQKLIKVLSDSKVGTSGWRALKTLQLQRRFVLALRSLATKIRDRRDRADRKTERLRELLTGQQQQRSTTAVTPVQTEAASASATTSPTPPPSSATSFIAALASQLSTVADPPIPSSTPGSSFQWLEVDPPIPLPVAPFGLLIGVIAQESLVVRSSQYPLVLACRLLVPPKSCDLAELFLPRWSPKSGAGKAKLYGRRSSGSISDGGTRFRTAAELKSMGFTETMRKYMFKTGDDLRQDQLVCRLVEFARDVFRSYGSDYRFSLYDVVAFSRSDGLIEFVEGSVALSSLKKVFPTIRHFLATYSQPTDPHSFHQRELLEEGIGVKETRALARSLENFVQSCSGYSVVTFLLGIGDRHLDNLLICEDGRLVHVDFGFILGDDPKPFPSPMKLCSEMIEALGGLGSEGYALFQLLCCQCYRSLRRHAKVLLDVVAMMTESGIKALRADPEGALGRMREKFQSDMTEVEAETFLLNIIAMSATALFPAVVDKIHEWAVYWK